MPQGRLYTDGERLALRDIWVVGHTKGFEPKALTCFRDDRKYGIFRAVREKVESLSDRAAHDLYKAGCVSSSTVKNPCAYCAQVRVCALLLQQDEGLTRKWEQIAVTLDTQLDYTGLSGFTATRLCVCPTQKNDKFHIPIYMTLQKQKLISGGVGNNPVQSNSVETIVVGGATGEPVTANDEPGTANDEPGTANDDPVTTNDEPGTANDDPVTAAEDTAVEEEEEELTALPEARRIRRAEFTDPSVTDYPDDPRDSLDSNEKARRDSNEKPKRDSEEKAKRDLKKKARRGSKEKPKRDSDEKARRGSKEKPKRDSDEKARRGSKEKPKRDSDEKARRDSNEKAKRDLKKKARRGSKEKPKRDSDEKAKRDSKEN